MSRKNVQIKVRSAHVWFVNVVQASLSMVCFEQHKNNTSERQHLVTGFARRPICDACRADTALLCGDVSRVNPRADVLGTRRASSLYRCAVRAKRVRLALQARICSNSRKSDGDARNIGCQTTSKTTAKITKMDPSGGAQGAGALCPLYQQAVDHYCCLRK